MKNHELNDNFYDEIEINHKNIVLNFKDENDFILFSKDFDICKINSRIRILQDKKALEIIIKLDFYSKDLPKEKIKNFFLEFRVEKLINYFRSLDNPFIFFENSLYSIYQKILEKLSKKKFNITLNLTEKIVFRIREISKIYCDENFKGQSSHEKIINDLMLSEDFLNFVYFNLSFQFDEDSYIFKIPINNLEKIGNSLIYNEIKKKTSYCSFNTLCEHNFYLKISHNREVRKANLEDVPLILNFIKEIADFERLLHEVYATEDTLKNSLFGEKSNAEVLFYEIESKPVAFCIYFHNFSTFMGKSGLYLEDIYVNPEYRNQGIGSDFFIILAKIAKQRGCGRFEWSVLNWNEKAIQFYKKMGAFPMSEWTVYRMDSEKIDKLSDKKDFNKIQIDLFK